MTTNKQILESRLQQIGHQITSIENHILKSQIYINNLKENYAAARKAWFAMRDNVED